jgi:hypothetical protein
MAKSTKKDHRTLTIEWFGKLFCCAMQPHYLQLVGESYDQLARMTPAGMMTSRPPRDVAFSLAGGILAAHFDNVIAMRARAQQEGGAS